MLPSRGIARSVPLTAPQRLAPNRLVASRGNIIGNGRQYSVISRRCAGAGSVVNSPCRPRYATAPLALGWLSSSRNLSSWGWGWGSKKDSAESTSTAATETTTTTNTATTTTATPMSSETDAKLEAAPAPTDTAAAPIDASPAATAAAEPAVPTTEIDLSALINAEDILNMPEGLGYLHAIGLDYGWGFTSTMQWVLEHVHVYSGLGWGGSVVATAFLLRAVMFYPQLQSLRFNAVMQRMRRDPRSNEAIRLVQQGFQDGNMEVRQKGQVLNKMLRQEYGVSNWGIVWGFMQIPFTFGLFRTVSGMTHIPVPSLESAGYLWFTDLTTTDPYFVLPAAGTALMMAAVAINSKYAPPKQKKMLKPMMYIFGTVGFIGTTFLSSAVNLMTVALGASTLLTAMVLDVTPIRRALGLPLQSDIPPPRTIRATASYEAPRAAAAAAAAAPTTTTPTAGANPAAAAAEPSAQPSMREQLTASLNDMKKGFSDSVSNYTGTYQGTDAEKAERKRKDMLRKLEEMRRQQERDEFERKYKGKK